jgi:hypothetical protein
MGPKRKPTLAEQLEELRAQVQRQDAELKKKNQELGTSRGIALKNAFHAIGICRVLTLWRHSGSSRKATLEEKAYSSFPRSSWPFKKRLQFTGGDATQRRFRAFPTVIREWARICTVLR